MKEAIKIKVKENSSLLEKYREKVKLIQDALSISKKIKKLKGIDQQLEQKEIWQDSKLSGQLQKERSRLEETVNMAKSIKDMFENYELLEDLAINDNDEDLALEALELFPKMIKKIDEAEQKALLSDEVDGNNAIVSINAGAGGTESCDWAAILSRMIIRYAEDKRFKIKILDTQEGDAAGIKSTTMLIEGNLAFGLLKSETGIHRLVRISPFDSNARRHTSFASLFVSPEIDDNVEIEIVDKDLRIDVFRAGGAGGQSVNTTDSAVRITHKPSGLVVTCQNERSQLQNKMYAMKVLRSRLYEKKMEELKAQKEKVEGEKKEIGWGSQIRSYVLHPYKMVKDHRTGHEVGCAEKVLNGDLNEFVKAYLQWIKINA